MIVQQTLYPLIHLLNISLPFFMEVELSLKILGKYSNPELHPSASDQSFHNIEAN